MKRSFIALPLLLILGPAFADLSPATAILPFQERGASLRGQGSTVSDILFAELAVRPEILLVDREDLNRQLAEQQLGASGLVQAEQAARVGQLTGARALVTGSVIEAGSELYLVARIISTETGRVFGARVNGNLDAELAPMVRMLAEEVAGILIDKSDDLAPPPPEPVDVIAQLREQLEDKPRPVLYISVEEQHIGRQVIDPAVETELSLICRELGFRVLDVKEGNPADADLRILGEGFSEFAARHGDFVSVKARVELRVLDRDGNVLVYDRQTTLAVDIAENIAGKTALQNAAATLAGRILPGMIAALPGE